MAKFSYIWTNCTCKSNLFELNIKKFLTWIEFEYNIFKIFYSNRIFEKPNIHKIIINNLK